MNDHIDSYSKDTNTAGTFENKVLYEMCFKEPNHDSADINSGKILAIGRIYAASPERGAGKQKNNAEYEPLSIAIGRKLAQSELDEKLNRIDYKRQFSDDHTLELVIETHMYLNGLIKDAIIDWGDNKNPNEQTSFASKYLHFHRPNAFPIIDSFVKQGLRCVGHRGSFVEYEDFCKKFLDYKKQLTNDNTLRSIDTELLKRGRVHIYRKKNRCIYCNKT